MAEIETAEIEECLYMHNFRENHLDEQSRTGYPCNENRIPCNENRIPCNENGIPAMITGNGFAVKGVFLSKKSSLIMAHFSAENGLLFTVAINELLCLKNAGAQISMFFTSNE